MKFNRRRTISKRKLQQRALLWPELNPASIWVASDENPGFKAIPRTMPIIMGIMDDMNKNFPVSRTYLEIFCRTFDEFFLQLSNPVELAFHSGFTGQRARLTWEDRMRRLHECGFINIKPGLGTEFGYAVVLNPYHVIKDHFQNKHPGITQDSYNALASRALEVSASDLDEPEHPVTEEPES